MWVLFFSHHVAPGVCQGCRVSVYINPCVWFRVCAPLPPPRSVKRDPDGDDGHSRRPHAAAIVSSKGAAASSSRVPHAAEVVRRPAGGGAKVEARVPREDDDMDLDDAAPVAVGGRRIAPAQVIDTSRLTVPAPEGAHPPPSPPPARARSRACGCVRVPVGGCVCVCALCVGGFIRV